MGRLSWQSRGARPMFCSRRGNRFTSSITCPGRSITGTMWNGEEWLAADPTSTASATGAPQDLHGCKEIVDDELNTMWKPGTTAKELYKLYIAFGPDPFVVPLNPKDAAVEFSAWTYAKEQCEHLASMRG